MTVNTNELAAQVNALRRRTLAEVGAVNDVVGGEPVVVLWGSDTADALDTTSARLSQALQRLPRDDR